ncbi:glycosyltransferase [Lactiplantibacillus sp. WILCCON 0030]|uniref:Glycosyltransferase n=1 Tax=Lactiplantibacillus brownii TaxID=3069269 RepID=A0ABU1AAI6_9LACO|nr:glycosyltransferase [Lactiplantibacillus brownii]MDQ7937355.1 glycosyltransferase [Lactiplantibacillus brownii]
MQEPRITVIVPCYNEEEVLPKSSQVLGSILTKMIQAQQIRADSQVLFVDDGSSDKTWTLIKRFEAQNRIFSGLKFSRNFGHQNALMAGMKVAGKLSDAVITIDADLQDDPNLITEMVAHFKKGSEIVLGVRNDRTSDTIFKRFTAEKFWV